MLLNTILYYFLNSQHLCLTFLERPKVPEIDLVFALTATTRNADDVFQRMRSAVKIISDTYGMNKLHYSVIVYGDDAKPIFDFKLNMPSRESLRYIIDRLQRISGRPDTVKALEEAMQIIKDSGVRPTAKTILVFITDGVVPDKPREVEKAVKAIEEQGAVVLEFALVDNPQTDFEVPSDVKPKELAEKVMKNVLAGENTRLSHPCYCAIFCKVNNNNPYLKSLLRKNKL